jgi:hypothetical protein
LKSFISFISFISFNSFNSFISFVSFNSFKLLNSFNFCDFIIRQICSIVNCNMSKFTTFLVLNLNNVDLNDSMNECHRISIHDDSDLIDYLVQFDLHIQYFD